MGRIILYIVCFYGNYEICEYFVCVFFVMIRERDIDDFLVFVLVVRGGSVCVINFFFDKLILFINDVDKMKMFYVVKCLEKVEII